MARTVTCPRVPDGKQREGATARRGGRQVTHRYYRKKWTLVGWERGGGGGRADASVPEVSSHTHKLSSDNQGSLAPNRFG